MLQEDRSERDGAWSRCFLGPREGQERFLPPGCETGGSERTLEVSAEGFGRGLVICACAFLG